MDPKDPKAQNNQTVKPESTVDDLHAEGVDIVGSGVSEENEFSTPSASAPVQEEQASAPDPYREPVAQQPAQPMTPQETSKEVAPAPAPQPAPQSAPPIVPSEAQASQEQPYSAKNDPSIKPIRTFKSDAEEAVRYKNVSAIDIAVAEQKRREAATPIERAQENPKSSLGMTLLALGMVILVLVGGWYYWFTTTDTGNGPLAPVQVVTKTIIPYERASTFKMAGADDPVAHISAKLASSNASLGTVFAVIPVAANGSSTEPITTILANASLPSKLSRSLAPEYMIGSYSYETQSPFIILKTTYFQNAFAGMLEWEKDMFSALMPLVLVAHPDAVTAGAREFEDAVVSNVDARAVRAANGDVLLAYAFADNEHVVIATSDNALKHVLDRILTVRTIQ